MPHQAARPQSSAEGAEPAQGLPGGARWHTEVQAAPPGFSAFRRPCVRQEVPPGRRAVVRRRAGQATWYLPTSRKWRSASGVLSSRAALAAARRAGLMDGSARMRAMATRSSSAWAMR